ncbi:glycosyltransferase [Chryseolinea serpens]|uniref:glycosyltransferase n=1 Tax=Chryseolinea serpens TaxID=947013 RepID=UPI0015C10B2C|nr:glycosyltransferase [Chryseolinea serpens]
MKADRRAVYCHNPAPFYKVSWREFLIEPKFALFNLVYLIFYRINIKRNKYTIVQQDWLRDEFAAIFGLRKEDIIVARPEGVSQSEVSRPKVDGVKRFIFPALPRVWKNFEVIGEAVTILNARGITNFEVMWTLSGDENKYASWLKQQYADVHGIHFLGGLKRSRLFEVYGEVDCLIFPSKLESWGLPISEFKNFNKAILLADLPYAHETMGNYDKVSFFSPSSAADLAERMIGIIEGKDDFDGNTLKKIQQPYAKNWDALFTILLAP